MSVGSPLSWGTFPGHGERPAVAGHGAACRATSHLHHGGDPAPPRGDRNKSLGEIWEGGGGKEGGDLALRPSVGHTDLPKWKPLAIITTMEAGHQPGVDHRHTPKPTFAHFLFCAPP